MSLTERRVEAERQLVGHEVRRVREFRTRGGGERLMVAFEPPGVAR